jgi:hypothetical protein
MYLLRSALKRNRDKYIAAAVAMKLPVDAGIVIPQALSQDELETKI